MKFVEHAERGCCPGVLDSGRVKARAQKLSRMWEHLMTIAEINSNAMYAAHIDDYKIVLRGFRWF